MKKNTPLGTEKFPKTPTTVYDIFCCYKKPTSPHQTHAPPAVVIFVQNGDTGIKTVPGNYGISFADVTCYLHGNNRWHVVRTESSRDHQYNGKPTSNIKLLRTYKFM